MLIKEELLKYCKFYHDEVISPYTDSPSTLLWMAEKFICEEGTHLIDDKNIKESFTDIISSFIGKWSPYKHDKIMLLYYNSSN